MTTKEQVLEIIRKDLESPLITYVSHLIKKIEQEIQEPKIKQLEFDNNGIAYALDDCFTYQIWEEDDGGYDVQINGEWKDNEAFKTLDQAKAYAQEHFEGLIRGCYE